MLHCTNMHSGDFFKVSASITINISARKLYLYQNNQLYKIYPVAVGRSSTPTPKGNFKIIDKVINPGGSFGARWLGLNKKGYGIHGTNKPASLVKAISNGYIKMYNKDVLEVSSIVYIGTPVKII